MVDLIRSRLAAAVPLPLVLLLLTSQWPATSDAEVLNDYILDYQPLTFNPTHLEEKHQRVRRNADPFLRWNFRAYGRTFNLKLQPAVSMFASDHHLDVGDVRENFVDTSHIYEGIISGEPTSRVHMSIHNGSLLGYINIPGQPIYHLEPAKKYFKHPQYPSIIYPETRMNLDPYRHKRAAASSESTCFSENLYKKLEKMAQPLDSEKRKRRDLTSFEMENPYLKYSANVNDGSRLHRHRRALVDDKKTCFMSIRADNVLYKHVEDQEGSASKAKAALLSMFAVHISALNDIYEKTNFATGYRGIRFQLQRSTIITACRTGALDWDSGYCNDNLDVSNFLDLTSRQNHDDFCLVHTFTYRDFIGGTLGLAWVATPDSRTSGVCGRYGKVSDNGRISSKSLNTGITTLINFNREVASRVSQLTFAHEVGHNFGSQHDKTAECAPFGTSQSDASQGNYIMYPNANTGSLPHNNEFSECSKASIAAVLEKMGSSGGRVYCFKESDAAFCGNNVVEKGEQCDCGYADECDDECCIARPIEGDSSDMCKLKPTATDCSPTEGPCCKADCTFLGSGICHEATDCTEISSCVANNASCPEPANKPNIETFCDDYDRVCIDGECIGSVCGHINWTECYMTEDQVESKEEMCYVSCQKDPSSKCVSSFHISNVDNPEYAEFKKLLTDIQAGKNGSGSNLGIKRVAGSKCNYGKGYCDIFSKCRSYDAEGPFRQLTKLIFDPVTFQNIEDWIVDHWWAVLLMGVGVVLFMAVFVKVFGYNTPSEDPKRAARRQAMPRTNPQADKRSANQQRGGGGGSSGGAKRGAAYSPDYPLHDSQPYRAQGQGQLNHGYQGYPDHPPSYGSNNNGRHLPSYQGSSNRGPHQQFDRISGPRRY